MRRWTLGVTLLLVALAAGCGGDDKNTQVTVTVAPATVTVAPGGTVQFTAGVTGVTDVNVTWAVNDVTGGNATVGTITTAGLYTAPTTAPNPANVTVKATSVAQTSASGTATVTVDSGIRVRVTPSSGTVGTTETLQFAATVTGTSNLAVNWFVNDVAGGNATLGTVSASGLYTAPAAVPSPAAVNVRAVSAADSTQSGSAAVTVTTASDPTLTEISPPVTAQGSLFQDLYLTGTNFLSTTLVRVNGTAVPATLISNTLLRARVPASQLESAGMRSVDVMRQSGAATAPLSLTVEAVRPALVGTSPDSAGQGGGAVSVNFNGGYFSPAVTAEFDGQVRAASVTSARQLNVTLSAADVSAAGLFSVAVRNSAATPPLAAVNLAVQPSAAPSPPVTVPVGMMPSAVAINTATGVAVIANRGSNSISLLNLASNTVTGPVTVGTAPTGVAVDNNRNVAVVANNGSDTISIVDLAAGAVTATITSPTPSGATAPLKPVAVGVNSLTGLALVANQAANLATVIDLSNNTVLGTISASTGTNPAVDIEPRLNWGIITPGGAGALTIVDLGRRSVVVTVSIGPNVQGVSINTETKRALLTDPTSTEGLIFSLLEQSLPRVALDQGHVAAAVNPLTDIGVTVSRNTNQASIIDLRTPTRLIPTVPVGMSPRAVAIDPGTNTAVVANEGSNNVSILFLGAIRPLHLLDISPHTVFSSGSSVVVTVTGSGFVQPSGGVPGSTVRLDGDGTVISTAFVSSRRLTATIPASLLGSARRFALDVENPGGVRSNVTDFTVIQPVTVGTAPKAVAIDPHHNVAVVANSGSDNISVVNLATGAVTATIAVNDNPQGVAVFPRRNRAVVTNRTSNTASLVDLAAGMVSANINLAGEPLGVAINQDTGIAAVVTAAANSLQIFNAESGANITNLTVEQRPVAVAIDPGRNLAAIVHTGANSLAFVPLGGTLTISGRIAGFQLPTGVLYDPVSDRFLALSSLFNSLVIINPDTLQASAPRVGINPTSLAYNFQSGTLVTVNTASNTMSVMDFQDLRIRAILPLAATQMFAVEIHPRTNLAVVVDEAGDRILLVPLPR